MPQIDGSNGTWDYTVSRTNFSPPEDKIVLKFTPKKGVKCSKVRLVQTCKPIAFGEGDKEIPGPPEDWYAKKGGGEALYGPTRPDRVKDDKGRAEYVDHGGCDRDPYYDEDDGVAAPATQMTDFPSLSFADGNIKDGIKRIVKVFMTCAVCVETGEILGCFTWTSTSSAGEQGQIEVRPADKEGTVDETFNAALKQFVKNHSKTKDGTVYWWCPDGKEDPFGKAIPDGFQKKWLASESPHLLRMEGLQLGGARRVESPREAIALAMQDATHAAVKFTWTGDQEKPIRSVIIAAAPWGEGELAPHLDEERRFANDSLPLRFFVAPIPLLHTILRQLSEASETPDFGSGPVAITIMAGIATAPASHTCALQRATMGELARRAVPHTDEPQLLRALQYLALNMGA